MIDHYFRQDVTCKRLPAARVRISWIYPKPPNGLTCVAEIHIAASFAFLQKIPRTTHKPGHRFFVD
jgi:hypothetical protein